MEEESRPFRRWFYLGGEFRTSEGVRTTDPGDATFPSDAWFEYDAEVSFQLTESYESLEENGDVKLLDLSMFSHPPLPYQIWRGRKVHVRNPAAPKKLLGQESVGGFRGDFWTELENRKSKMLPKDTSHWVDMGVAKVVGNFYQCHHDHVAHVKQLMSFFEDPRGLTSPPAVEPRKRIVLMIEFPPGWSKYGGYRSQIPAGQDVVPLEEGDPPVYEWWYGDRPLESECNGQPPRGFWRRYHPTVCRRLERAWQSHVEFSKCRAAADVDGVRYKIQRLMRDEPFHYRGDGHRVVFQEINSISTQYPCFENLDRVTDNCLVQFRSEDPNRRRPARRRMNAEEIARNAARTGEPCCICFSEAGEVTGCAQLHVICGYCLRAGLRSMIGDITVLENLLCGCFSHSSRGTVSALAERSDKQLQDELATPHVDAADGSMLLEDELQETRRQFGITSEAIYPDLYSRKIREWYDKVIRQQIMPNYYVCAHPDCADEVENWMLRETFDTEYRSQGRFEWSCPRGHRNTVLPVDQEIQVINRTMLLHPEYYVERASCDDCPLRQYRLCPGCVEAGILMLAMHAEGCKQWPGGGSAHRHCFCFSCTKTWGSECNHGVRCTDPGIQQVRKISDRLEIGHVNGDEYLKWLRGERADPPPTAFPTEPATVDGMERQEGLGMAERQSLLKETDLRKI